MAILKCKMCGGDIELSADKTFGTCDSCGSTMTFPKVDDEQRASMFNRGNHFRRQGEFDKALAVYERIVQEDENDAEAHWCCALCRFGIEYVEDPNTFEYLPTCHRASFDSFLEDVDYLAAVEHSDGVTRRQYQKDAAKIAEVQRGILATSQNEEPFDVFICYKESENDGSRTRDSLMAQEIYYQLTEQGRRVFFSRITLEDKAGTEYEPYIFAALNSAKVMILVTTSAEHANAVWVKNEWSRFLSLMRKDRSKLLLPCYRDMDPYDLPEALSVLQSYDMGKIGFIQDLIRGINKVLDADKPKETVKETIVVQQVSSAQGSMVASLLKRVFMFLEDGDWNSANEYCEKVLDLDPENAEAYLGKLMAETQTRKREYLKNMKEPFEGKVNCQKACRFGTPELKRLLDEANKFIRTRNEQTRIEAIYAKAEDLSQRSDSDSVAKAAELFGSIPDHRDAAARRDACLNRAEQLRQKGVYLLAENLASKSRVEYIDRAIELFDSILSYRDSAERKSACEEKLKELRKQELYEQAKKLETNLNVESLRQAAELYAAISDYMDAEARHKDCIDAIERIEMHNRQIEAYHAQFPLLEEESDLQEKRKEKVQEKRTTRVIRFKAGKITLMAIGGANIIFGLTVFLFNLIDFDTHGNMILANLRECPLITFIFISFFILVGFVMILIGVLNFRPTRARRARVKEIDKELADIDRKLSEIESYPTFETWCKSQN